MLIHLKKNKKQNATLNIAAIEFQKAKFTWTRGRIQNNPYIYHFSFFFPNQFHCNGPAELNPIW